MRILACTILLLVSQLRLVAVESPIFDWSMDTPPSGAAIKGSVIPGDGVKGNALYFEAKSWAAITSPVVDLAPPLTFECWVKGDGTGFLNQTPCIASSAVRFFDILASAKDGALCVALRNDATAVVNTGNLAAGLFDGTWHHVVVVMERTQLACYVDGEKLFVRSNLDWGAEPVHTSLVLGDRPWNGDPFTGALDEVILHRRALSADEVRTRYTALKPKVRAVRVLAPSTAAVEMDGVLDDPLWTEAAKLAPFNVFGTADTLSNLGTEAFAAIRDGWLYVGYRCPEPNPAGMKNEYKDDVLGIYNDDCVQLLLSCDQRSYEQILVTSQGQKFWAHRVVFSKSPTWYPIDSGTFAGAWETKTHVGETEWSCEIRIKLADYLGREPSGDETIFINVARHRPQGTEEYSTWAPITGQTLLAPKAFLPVTLSLPRRPDASIGDYSFTRLFAAPDLLLVGKPVRLTRTGGEFQLPARMAIVEEGAALDPGVRQLIADAVNPAGATATLTCGEQADPFAALSLTADEEKSLSSPEAFLLTLTPDAVSVVGRSREGTLRGIAAYVLMARRAQTLPFRSLPTLVMADAPRMKDRTWLVHFAEFNGPIQRILDTAFLLRFNAVVISADSFGGQTTFPFSLPGVGGTGITKAQWQGVFDYARARGIEPIPYLASWGRVQYLTRLPQYAKFAVSQRNPNFVNLDVANDDAIQFMLSLQEELIDTLHPKALHIAFDEMNASDLVTSERARAKGWKNEDWIVAALTANADFLRKKGVAMHLWGDMLDPSHNGKKDMYTIPVPELLAKLPKDMVIYDWKYEGGFDSMPLQTSTKMFKDAGFTVLGCPWFRPRNISGFAHSVLEYGLDGMCLTLWNTARINQLRPETVRSVSLAAYLSWSPEEWDLERIPIVPDILVEYAGLLVAPLAAPGTQKQVAAPDGLADEPTTAAAIGFPRTASLSFLDREVVNGRGVRLAPFTKDGRIGALLVRGGSSEAPSLQNGDFGDGTMNWSMNGNGFGSYSVEDGVLKCRRTEAGYMIAVQDAVADPAESYVLRFRIKGDGDGGHVWVIPHDETHWDESHVVHSQDIVSPEWQDVELALPTGSTRYRVFFAASGNAGTACLDDVAVVKAGAAAPSPSQPMAIAVDARAAAITFLHTASAQDDISDSLDDMVVRWEKQGPTIVATYRVVYADGTSARIPLQFRVHIGDVNYSALGRETTPALFGTLSGTRFFNLPTYTWVNPDPGKTIARIEIIPGGIKNLDLVLFGVTLEE